MVLAITDINSKKGMFKLGTNGGMKFLLGVVEITMKPCALVV